MQPTPRQDPWRRPDGRSAAENDDSGARDVSIGAAVRRLDRLDAEGSFDRRQGQARRYHARRRRRIAQRAGGRCYHRDPACSARRKAVALAYPTPQTQVAEAGRRGTGQQDGAHRVEDDGDRRDLHREIYGRRRLKIIVTLCTMSYGSASTAFRYVPQDRPPAAADATFNHPGTALNTSRGGW